MKWFFGVVAALFFASQGLAQLPGTFQPLLIVSAALPASISYQTNANDASAGTVHTFSTQAIGTASATRTVIVGVCATGVGSPTTLTSATIGGISATIHVQVAGAARGFAAIISAAVPTGTTATIVNTFAGSVISTQIGVWAAYDLLSSTPVGTNSATTTTTGQALSMNVNTTANGVLASITCDNDDNGLATSVWAGASGTGGDFAVIGSFGGVSGAHYAVAATETPRTFSDTWVISSRGAGAVASFR